MGTIDRQPPELDPETRRVLEATRLLCGLDLPDEGASICRWMLEREPDNPVAWNDMGFGYGRKGRIRKALECYNRAIALWPEYPEAWNNMGSALGDLGRIEESLLCATRAVELGPRGWIRLRNKASSLEQLGRYQEALHCYQQMWFLDPDSQSVQSDYRRTLGRHRMLVVALREAVEEAAANRSDPFAWCALGFSLSRLQRLEESIQCYDRALEVDRTCDNAWAGRGMVLRKLNRHEEALSSLDQALELGQAADEEEHFGAWHQKGLCLATLGDPVAAIDCHARTVALWPRHPTAWFDKGLLEDRLGRLDDAKASYRALVERESYSYIGQREWAEERLAELEEASG